MANIARCLVILLFFAQTRHSQGTSCMSGFLAEDALRNKAALIGQTITRNREQVIIPAIKFTCAGTLTKWRFVAERNTNQARNRYPELQIWRPQSSQHIYDKIHSVTVTPQSTSHTNVYTHTLGTPVQYQAGDVLGIYHPPANSCAYKIYSVEHGGPDNYRKERQEQSSVRFDVQATGVRVRKDYPLIGAETNNPQCLSGFVSRSVLETRASSLSGDNSYQALSNQQRLIPSLTYGCQGKIGRILVAAQNRGRSGNRNRYPEIFLMRLSTPSYYIRMANFTLNEYTDIKSPNVLEFIASSSTYARQDDVIRIYQPQSSDSVYQVYHEPGVGPNNYYISGITSNTRNAFPVESVSSQDTSQPLFIVELVAKCPSLQSPTNGNVEFSDSVAVYECDSGYRLDGPEQRLCDNDTAEWIGSEPQCILVNCGTLAEVSHGSFSLSRGTGLDSVATYSCDVGYVLDGHSTRQCQTNERWSGEQPICKRQCSALSSPMNGVVLSPTLPAVQGDRAIFSCDADYELIGATSSTCQENGQWSSSPPTCELIQCPELHNPGNGTVSISLQDRRVGSTATFQCNFGYQLSGQASVLCQQNRQWSAQSPACQLIQCPSLSNPLNGVVQVNNREAVYTCSEGYRMVGVERRLCQLGGVWSGQPPTCDEIQCPMLNNPLNGRVEFTSRAVGSTAQYTCNTGYHLIGVASVICELPTGQWTNTPPACELIDCGVPDIPRNGYVSLPSGGTHLNNYAHYYCNTGYTVQGSEQRRCQENGLWSGNMPGCLAIDCGPAPALLHGEVTTNSTLLHGVATYNCTTGYRLTSGSSNLVCADTGLWTGTPPSCSVVTCSRLTPPENGNVFWDSTEFNSTASYTCRDGFLLSGVSVRVCQANGFWSNRPPVCSRIPPVSTTSLSEFYPQPSLLTSTSTTTTQLATPNSDDLRASPNNDFTTSPYATHSNSVPALSNVPTFTDSKPSDKNVFIVCGMIVVMLILISLVVVLIIVVYLRRRKMNTLAAAAANSVENPLYSGHGNTPLATLNCFRMGNGCKPCKSPNSGFEMQEFGFQSMAGSEEDKFGVSTAVHLYDFPTLHNSEEKHGVYEHYEEAGGVGHSYEFPDHYHLPTQYEVPVSPYERPKPQARLHIYKNTLQEDVDVPTSDERRKSVSVERQIKRQVSWKTNSSVSQSVADENPFLESSTYWRPASDPASLYEQLAQNKYREIIRKYIKVTEVLGSGQFGQVHRGIWQRSGGAMDVAIKTLKEGAVEEDKVRFLQEAAVSGQFQHPNVVRLQGVVTVGEPIMIILELLPNGDLRNYLQKQRPATGEVLGDHWPQQLLHFSRDIASGMNYLSSKAFVHRDLAARNILVAEDRTCKIGDFGMSRDLDEENYYISNGGKIPVKWTAPEALHYKKYSTASDVWSFGIVMFEIWSLGHKPFEKHSNTETIKMTDQGLRLPPPPGCPRAIYQLMIQCWHPAHTASRPTFHALVHALSRDSTRLLHWSKGDSEAHPQAAVLGAPLEAGLDLYVDLQRTYIPSTVTSS